MARRLAYSGRHRNHLYLVPPFDPAALERHRLLVSRMAAGDTRALRELHDVHVGQICGIVNRILSDREEAREAVQDAFVKAWRRAASYRPERGEVISWLVLIARNTAVDRLRESRRRREIHTQLASAVTAVPPSAPDPTNTEREELDHQLAELSAAQRQVLELAFYAGCSQAEIADRMQVPVSTVKNHLHRGLTKLRQINLRHD